MSNLTSLCFPTTHNPSRGTEYDLCPCLALPESFKNAIGAMMDVSLLRDPVFMMIGVSNIFGMAGLYVPFVYLVDAAVLDVSPFADRLQ